jgi:dipeptidyl aminopeptidase/acylaminoacyl peptidase
VALLHPPPSPEQVYAFDTIEIRVVEVASGRTRFAVPKSGLHVVSWSPVENVLLFDRDSCRPSDWQLTLVDGDGNNMRPLANPSLEVQPMFHAWSPDGRRIAVVSSTDVILIDLKSGATESTRLTVQPPLFGISWLAPDWLSVFAGGGTDFCP